MFKKFLSALLCFAVAFTVTISAFVQSGSIDVQAASSVPLYLKYYYDQLDKDTQTIFLEMRDAVLNCDKKITFEKEIDDEAFEKAEELLIFHEPMSFNVKDYFFDPEEPDTLIFKYKYKKDTYKKMISAYEKKVDNILAEMTDDMSRYRKIKTIHDAIINTAVYDLEAPNNGNLYGTLVEEQARCVGYAHTFSYICSKAGIQAVSVVGFDYPITNKNEMHMWNKVYYNKMWYNVDTTWDDPVNNLTDNLTYDYFMISDESMFRDHLEYNFSFEAPAAEDDSKAYYVMNNKYAEDLDSAKSIIKSSMKTAAKNDMAVISFQCSSYSVCKEVMAYLDSNDVAIVFEVVKYRTNKNLIDEIFSYSVNSGQYVVTMLIFYENTSLNKYYSDTTILRNSTKSILKKYRIQ